MICTPQNTLFYASPQHSSMAQRLLSLKTAKLDQQDRHYLYPTYPAQ